MFKPYASSSASSFLLQASKEPNPVKKKSILDQAASLYPDDLAVQEELLHLGRLWQRDPRHLDYHIIKCYLLHVFEEPASETPDMRRQMLTELTEDPQLLRCRAMAGEGEEAFLRRYVTRMCRDYVKLFLVSSNSKNGTIMGLRIFPLEKCLAKPVATMLHNMEDASLPAPFDTLFPECLLDVFRADIGNDTHLMAALEEFEQ